MAPYNRHFWFMVLFVATTTASASLVLELDKLLSGQESSNDLMAFDRAHPDDRGRIVVNLSDVAYKSALRLLRCSAVPDNPHDITLLDPLVFNLDELDHRETIRLDGTINGTESYLSQLKINYVSATITSASAEFRGVLPRLSIAGNYNVTGSLAQVLPVFGFGPYSVEVSNVSLRLITNFGLYKNGSVYMSNFTIDFSPQSIQVNLGEVLGGGPLGALIQDFLQDAALQMVARSRSLIQTDLRKTVLTAANHRLATIGGVSDLIRFLVTFSNATDVC